MRPRALYATSALGRRAGVGCDVSQNPLAPRGFKPLTSRLAKSMRATTVSGKADRDNDENRLSVRWVVLGASALGSGL